MKVRLKSPEEFKSLMIQKGFNQRTFAKQTKISYSYLSQIINEQLYPSGKTAKKMYDALGVSFDDIFFVQNGHNSNH